jgi:hemerythrin superfamily protein
MTKQKQEHLYDKMTREELYELAQERDIPGRSELSKEELAQALEREDQGPDAIRLLTDQHEQIRTLFEEFDGLSARASKRKQELVREMITTLVKHTEIEEQVFYPAVAAEVEGQAALVDESYEEHHAAELLLAEIDRMSPEDERFDAKVRVMTEMVTHHIEEEEQELFPEVEQALPEERRREIGAAMVQMWRIAPTRPHPRTPYRPPANVITAIPATVIDLTVGAAREVRRRIHR